MNDYLTWCEKVRHLTLSPLPAQMFSSTNKIGVVTLDDGERILRKIIRPDVMYIPRLKVLGETACSLLDYYLDPRKRVTPNVCPVSRNILWRQFIPGLPGELWRAELYKEKQSLEGADLAIVGRILKSRSAKRIALLDFITLHQDRSARNWIAVVGNRYVRRFCAIDNGILWAYKGRHADKEAIRTDSVEHLRPPMEALIAYDRCFEFKIGLFTSLFAGQAVSVDLLTMLQDIDWDKYKTDLSTLISAPLCYPSNIVDDWRIDNMKYRAEWILRRERYPSALEIKSLTWLTLIDAVSGFSTSIWRPEWEIENSETA